jgi:spermidine synthase
VGAGLLQARAVFLAVGLSGLTALGAQVVWTRLLTLLFGATVYAFSIILAVFLAGLGIGSAWASSLLRRGQDAARALAWSQLGVIPSALLSAYLLSVVLPLTSPSSNTPIGALHAFHVLRAVAVVLPGAVLWGMSFPLALAAAARTSGGDTGRSSGLVYAANTAGAIIGSLAVSFWLVPAFGTRVAQQTLVLVSALSGAALFFVIGRAGGGLVGRGAVLGVSDAGGWRMPVAWALAAGLLAAAVLPGPSDAFLAHGRYIWWMDARDRYPYVSEGAASTVAVHVAPDGYRNFHVSGRVEATNNPNDMRLQVMLGHLSALAHPKPESVLVVGLGAGVTAGALAQHPEVKRLVICEIEPRVVGAASTFAVENRGVLTDPKVQIVFDDARHFLATTRETFDVITSDPIHPWVRGNSVLFSREYYQVVRSRLKPGGIATQWVPLYETTEEAIQMQMKTFMDAFPEGTVWNSAANGRGYDVVMLGRTAPLRMDVAEIQARMDRTPAIGAALRDVRMGSALDLLATYGAGARDMATWFAKTPLNRDFSLKLEYISGMALNAREADAIYAHMTAERTYPADILVVPPNLEAELRRRIGARNLTPQPR